MPVIDAAIYKLIRLTGGFTVQCSDTHAENALRGFLHTVHTGYGQVGIHSFLDRYLDSLFTCGRAVGEILPHADGSDIAAVFCGNTDSVTFTEGESPLSFQICLRSDSVSPKPLPRQELLLFTPLHPENDHPYGVSLLRATPYFSDILLKIYHTIGQTWERCGNVRFAVNYKPRDGEIDHGLAKEHAMQIAEEWSNAMQSAREGCVRDFVSVGDVSIRVIGADNQILDSSIPVRQLLEQIVAKTGLPPFILGLSWSSTERMSSQQADILTTEITALRRTITPVIEKICRTWLRMHGFGCKFSVVWDDIDLQDTVEDARAFLYREQARSLQLQNDAACYNNPLYSQNREMIP